VVKNAAGQPVPGAQLIVQALLGIPFGHAAECVTSEFVQCDEYGGFAFEASYGTRGVLILVGDADAAKSQSPFAAGLDDYVVVGPSGVGKIERRSVTSASAMGSQKVAASDSSPQSSVADDKSSVDPQKPTIASDAAWSGFN